MSNHFDNDRLFEEYNKMRMDKKNYTDNIEMPASLKLLPSRFDGLKILDACCGFGKSSCYFADNGADAVVGIDISEKMIEKANKENCRSNTFYICSDISKLNPNSHIEFDIAYSSAAFHFVEDLDTMFKSIYNLLKKDGIFCFSMEHPIMSANSDEKRWCYDKEGNISHYRLKDYFSETYREHTWFSKDIPVSVYHRKMSTIINLLIKNGFVIEEVYEPEPDKEKLEKIVYDLYATRPSTLVIKCKK